jgi:hypothetical protein
MALAKRVALGGGFLKFITLWQGEVSMVSRFRAHGKYWTSEGGNGGVAMSCALN